MSMIMKILMERPLQFAVQAKIAQSSPPAAALFFTKVMQEAKQDLLQILGATNASF